MATAKDRLPSAEVDDRGGVMNHDTGKYDPRTEVPPGLTYGDLDSLIEERMQARDLEHQRELEALQARVPSDTVPLHGAGPGLSKRRSWSLAEQEAAYRGELPEEYYV